MIQPLPQYDETVDFIVAPALTAARDKRNAVKVANTTDFPYTQYKTSRITSPQAIGNQNNTSS